MGSERLVPFGLQAQFLNNSSASQIMVPSSPSSQTKFGGSVQQSSSEEQASPSDEHALTNIDAVKATTTARMDKRIFCAK
ncbi:hypothetical protein BDR04DRAFT_1090384 [Suillus decipiens]|nr:hypothetical protein BDR04DRAFT_1090384 [Suillus decipiens]